MAGYGEPFPAGWGLTTPLIVWPAWPGGGGGGGVGQYPVPPHQGLPSFSAGSSEAP